MEQPRPGFGDEDERVAVLFGIGRGNTHGAQLLAGLSVEQWTSICGLIAAIVGIFATIIVSAVTVWYRRKEYKLKEARAKHDLENLDEE